jgi:hypothetical protein
MIGLKIIVKWELNEVVMLIVLLMKIESLKVQERLWGLDTDMKWQHVHIL